MASILVMESAELAGETGESAVNVEAVLERVNSRLDYVKTRVYETVNCKLKEYVRAFKHTSELRKEVEELGSRVDSMRERCNSGLQEGMAVADQNKENLDQFGQQLEHTDVVISVLRLLVRLHEELAGFDEKMESCDFEAAAASVCDMREALQQLPTSNKECDAHIFSQVKEQYKRKRNTLKCKLEELFKQAIVFGNCKLSVHKELEAGCSTIALSVVLEALQALGWLEERVDTFTEKLRATIFEPILKRARTRIKSTNSHEVWLLSCEETPDTPAHIQPTHLFENVLSVVTFLADVFEVEEVVAHIGHVLWTGTGLCSTIIEECMMRSIPDTPQGLVEFRPVVAKTEEFEHALLAKEFIKADQLILTGFMADLERHYAEKKRRRFLTQARSLILMDDYNTVTVGGSKPSSVGQGSEGAGGEPCTPGEGTEEGDFNLPACKVSTRAEQLASMVREALAEAAASTSAQNQAVLYGAARDVLDLFRAIVAARHARTLERVPQLCAIFHNDCMFLAHECLLLGHQFKPKFQPPLSHTATFVDMVPPFRQLAERYFSVQMGQQQAELMQCLDNARGFANLEDEQAYGAASKALAGVQHHLSHLGRIWREVLPEGLYLRSMGALVGHAAERLLADVKALHNMHQTAVGNLADLVGCLVTCAQELLELDGRTRTADTVPCGRQLEAMAGLLEVAKAPAHYVHGARRGQLAVILTNVNQAFEDEDPQGMVQRLIDYDTELAMTLVQKMNDLSA